MDIYISIYRLKHPKRGFTMIELVIALLIMSMISFSLSSLMQTTMRLQRKSNQYANNCDEITSAQNAIRRVLERAATSNKLSVPSYTSPTKSLEVISTLPSSFQNPHPVKMKLHSVQRAGNTLDLVLSWASFPYDEWQMATVLSNIKSLNFMLVKDSRLQENSLDELSSKYASSDWVLIKFIVSFYETDKRFWPDFYIQVAQDHMLPLLTNGNE